MSPDIIQALVRTIELKDLSTAAHTWRVVLYTRAMAEHFGLPHQQVERLAAGAALHDLGKIDIPDEILQKPGPLSDEEFAIIRTHPVRGHERLVNMGETDPLILDLVRHHHERFDGAGYPDRLRGDGEGGVPAAARYFAVIDTFDALTSVRPYRREVGPDAAERAMEELHRGIGDRYAADSVNAFTALFRRGEIAWIMEYFNDAACAAEYCPLQADKARRERPRG